MRTTDITALVPPKTAAPTPQQMATRGTVTIPPASITDDTVTVILPSYSPDYGWPCRWIRQGNTLPAIGAECLVLWDETGAGTVVQWAGTFDAKRTVDGDVAADGSESSSEFSVVKDGTGRYTVTFATAFSATPTILLGWGDTAGGGGAEVTAKSASAFSVVTYNTASATLDNSFTFIARGPS